MIEPDIKMAAQIDNAVRECSGNDDVLKSMIQQGLIDESLYIDMEGIVRWLWDDTPLVKSKPAASIYI